MKYRLTLLISSLLFVSGCVWNKKEAKEHTHNRMHEAHTSKDGHHKHHGAATEVQLRSTEFRSPRQKRRQKKEALLGAGAVKETKKGKKPTKEELKSGAKELEPGGIMRSL